MKLNWKSSDKDSFGYGLSESDAFARCQSTGWCGLLLAISMSLVFVWWTFGWDFIQGTSTYWQSQIDDVAQYIAGFNLFFLAPWQFPLTAFDSLNYPQGTRLTFVDAIPLFSVALKILLPTSVGQFNPFGLYVSLCFVLQGIGAWWIARELRVRSWLFLVGLTLILLFFPALLARISHISLMSHWVLLFAIALSIRGYQHKNLPVWGWSALLIAAFYVNIYLFVMASSLLFASLFGLGRLVRPADFLAVALPFALLFLTALLMLLPLPISQVSREAGFGNFSMNLLAPFSGGAIIPHAKVAPGQYEGFNYLGLGVLAVLFWACLDRRRSKLWDEIKRHKSFVVLMLMLTLYALSNHIFFGEKEVLVLDYPSITAGITSQFRASGRFFWPVGYALCIFALWMLYRGFRGGKFVVVCGLVLIVQMIDVSKDYRDLKHRLERQSLTVLDYTLWDAELKGRAEALYFYPKFKCGKSPVFDTLLPVMRYTADRNLKLNTGYIARYTPQCDDVRDEIAHSDLNRSAYIFSRNEYSSLSVLTSFFPGGAETACKEVQFAYICTVRRKE